MIRRWLRRLFAPRVRRVRVDDWDQQRRMVMTPEECEEYNDWVRNHKWVNLEPDDELHTP